MRRRLALWVSAVLVAALAAAGGPAIAQEAGDAGAGGQELAPEALKRRGTTRIEFDPRAVEGQTKKAGAIYLFQRQDADLKSLVERRKSFREEVLRKLDE